MLNSCIDSVNRDLKFHKKLLRRTMQLQELCESYKGTYLETVKKKYKQYVISWFEDGKRKRKYINTDNLHIIAGIVGFRFSRTLIKRLESNIALMENFIEKYRPVDIDSTLDSLPETYRIKVQCVSELYDMKDAQEWKREAELAKKNNPNGFPEELTHFAVDNTPVRSKSEMLVYNFLYALGFVFVYEMPLRLKDGSVIYPDFTIYLGLGRVLYIEHDGAYGKPTKREKTNRKLGLYFDNGYAFGRDVLFTYDDPDKSIDFARIKGEIENAIKSLCYSEATY